ncbi:hypothetical protein [Archangium lansingense]|uniref:Lipoprotein n=1 Tax=Archangium lansingense TaxID=2995310 RepID=A0ABT4ABV5_9BACT|nr:hypothetical protein [Archangium lansinium]MCY1079137.1 hypothetical protein [Archangium lansinium]
MNRSSVLFSLMIGSLLLSACGVKAGDSCRGGGYTCASEKEALECRDEVWRTLQCRGASGCSESDGTVQCDMQGNLVGDSCAASAEGRGLCTADNRGVLECRMGVLTLVKTCGTCVMDDTHVTCEP